MFRIYMAKASPSVLSPSLQAQRACVWSASPPLFPKRVCLSSFLSTHPPTFCHRRIPGENQRVDSSGFQILGLAQKLFNGTVQDLVLRAQKCGEGSPTVPICLASPCPLSAVEHLLCALPQNWGPQHSQGE